MMNSQWRVHVLAAFSFALLVMTVRIAPTSNLYTTNDDDAIESKTEATSASETSPELEQQEEQETEVKPLPTTTPPREEEEEEVIVVQTTPNVYANHVQNCSLTVLLMDPKVGFYTSDDHMYNALESMADYTPDDACVTIHTSTCVMEQWLLLHNRSKENATLREWDKLPPARPDNSNAQSQLAALVAVRNNVYDRAPPLFRRRVDQGRVRFHVLNHTKYGWNACNNFYMTRNAWMDARYYVDEFVAGIDSDLLLVMERDTLLCRTLEPDRWRHHTFLGAPWSAGLGPSKTMMSAFDFDTNDMVLRVQHRDWVIAAEANDDDKNDNQTTTKIQPNATMIEAEHAKYSPDVWQAHWAEGSKGGTTEYYGPPPPDMPFPLMYHLDRHTPKVGNGGLSLRSRTWMLRAIHTCPHEVYAHIFKASSNCSMPASSRLYDDVYFGTILNVIGPTISSAEAGVFSTETLRPNFESPEAQAALQRLGGDVWVRESQQQYRKHQRYFPLGMHLHLGRYFTGCPPQEVCKYAACHKTGRGWWKRGAVG